eukprot:SAG11_NODE_788_length_7169_cov_1.889109_3_plen_139_part_00
MACRPVSQINNACQTVRRPAAYYQHLLQGEQRLGAAEAAAILPLLKKHERWVTSAARALNGGGGGGGGGPIGEIVDAAPAARGGGLAAVGGGEGDGDVEMAREIRPSVPRLEVEVADGGGGNSAAMSQLRVHSGASSR